MEDLDFGVELLNLMDGRLDRFHLEFGFPDQLAGPAHLRFQLGQITAVITVYLRHKITVAVTVPRPFEEANSGRVTMAFDKLQCFLWPRKAQN